VARGFKPPPGYHPPHRRPDWRLFALISLGVLIAFTAIGWFVLQPSQANSPESDVGGATLPIVVATVPDQPVESPKPPIKTEEAASPKAEPMPPVKPAADAVTFEQVSAVFQNRCVNCHGGQKQKGSLDLRTLDSALRGGDSGPAIVFGDPKDSPLWNSVRTGTMPPNKNRKLSEKEIDLIKRWIESGEK
jgi:mono/diheme cytochrome c family protein